MFGASSRLQSRSLPTSAGPGSRCLLATVRTLDPRYLQIASLGILLTFGLGWLGFDQSLINVSVILATILATQLVLGWIMQPGRAFDPLSALISGLSLCLLLRAGSLWVLALGAILAIGSKFFLRVDGKHVFNPTNFAIAVLLLFTDLAWISPSQWGSQTWAAFLFACLATMVLSRARRGDVALAFLGTYVAVLFLRALWLGDPWAIPMKQMQSGALLLFAFFMISDPKTTPDRRGHRILYGVLVACLGAWIQLGLYNPNGLMYALFFLSPLVVLMDRAAPVASTDRYAWSRPSI
ncbi:MAG TPA: RnfABCDGE type electron transport complex subunit D [Hyphomicrobiaceae bacterium]|nr:RnfABCDGE type electron transport complex subunit D [Hyphomicrobiaceae bacterium]